SASASVSAFADADADSPVIRSDPIREEHYARLAQRQGFLTAFREAFPTTHILPKSLLKGCYYHWKQSVQRIVSNHAVVPPGYDIREDFPNAKKWLDWWVHEEVAGMIFKSKGWLKDELQAHPTRTTNDIVYLNSTELDFDHIKNGGRADYRRKKTSKPRETEKFVNDGRELDTTKTLFDLEKKDEEKKNEEKKKEEEKKEEEKKEERKKSAAKKQREGAAKHAERIKENKKRSKQDVLEQGSKKRKVDDSNSDRSMHNNSMFKGLGLSRISADILSQCQLDDDYVLGFYNPKSDGNCGWRSASVVINNNEKHYGIVKLVMKHAIVKEKDFFTSLFGSEECYQYVLAKLSQTDGRVIGTYWFDVLDCPRVLAQAYNRPVIVYSCHLYGVHGTTFLPFREPEKNSNNCIIDIVPIVLYLIGNHFQLIVIKDDAVDRVIWPKLFPGYEFVISRYNITRLWLDLYETRCQYF
ncbi:hypothetical protein INT45_001999, partial [Circinella minor]